MKGRMSSGFPLYRIAFLLILSCVGSYSYAQDIKVDTFFVRTMDIDARTNQNIRYDFNDDPCALVKVRVANAQEFTFAGQVGDVIYKDGEIWVYLPDGGSKLTIRNDKYGAVEYLFPHRLKQKTTYELRMRVVENLEKKVRTLVMPVLGISKGGVDLGVMVALVRRIGPYIKLKSNFKGFSSDLESNDAGVVGENGDGPWYTSSTRYSRLAATAGAIYRIKPTLPIYVYAGCGYGYSKLGYKTVDGNWVKNTDQSANGIEAELGGIYRFNNIAVMAGIQTCGFKRIDGSIGIGIMF